MGIFDKHARKVLWIGLFLSVWLITGCTGFKPYEPRDNREEGLENGIFTGSEGEFVIFRKVEKTETGSGVSEEE